MNEPSEIWVQISSGQGPAECERVVEKVLEHFCREGEQRRLSLRILERAEGVGSGCLASVLLAVGGEGKETFAASWQGTILWTGQSPFRREHKRKNWYVGIEIFSAPEERAWKPDELSFESFRGSGPGGQNVNKVSTAVRLVHRPTGLAVVAREERFQHANRRLALARLAALLRNKTESARGQARGSRRLSHHHLERGNPVRSFRGPLEE